jgi:hypothetical protein
MSTPGRALGGQSLSKDESRRIAANIARLRGRGNQRNPHTRGRLLSTLYSHGEYRQCPSVISMPLLSISGRGEGTAAISGGEEGTGTAVISGRGEGTGTTATEGRACTGTVPNVQQWLVPTQTRCALGNLVRASLSVMQAGEPLASDGPIVEATIRIRVMRAVIA